MKRAPLFCKGVIIVCEDFRLHQRPDGSNVVAELVKKLGYDCDIITRGGGILDLVSPEDVGAGFDRSMMRDIKVAEILHQAEEITIIGHEDCRAYGYRHMPTMQAELNLIHADMRRGASVLKRIFPKANVSLQVARLLAGSVDKFELTKLA